MVSCVLSRKLLTCRIVCKGLSEFVLCTRESLFEEFVGSVYLDIHRREQLLRTGCAFQPCARILMCTRVPYSDVALKGMRLSGWTGIGCEWINEAVFDQIRNSEGGESDCREHSSKKEKRVTLKRREECNDCEWCGTIPGASSTC